MRRLLVRAMGAALCMAMLAAGGAAEVVGRDGMYGDVYIHRILAPNGQEIYYTSREEEAGMRIEDVNFDGVNDIVVPTALGASNLFCAFFVWDGEEYVRATYNAGDDAGLANFELYPELGLVYTDSDEGSAGALHQRCLYRWEGTELRCVRMAIAEEYTQWEFDEETGISTTVLDNDRIHVRVIETVYSETDGTTYDILWEEVVTAEDYDRLGIDEQEAEILWGGLR